MIRIIQLSLLLIFSLGSLLAQDKYRYTTDVRKVEDDLLQVELFAPSIKEKKALFHLPKIVPGTYSIYDFGRFVSELEAYNKKGKKLKVKNIDPNTWEIKKAHKLHRLVYKVEDTWDTKKRNVIFEPAGTNFDLENNVFVFNNHGIFGYFKGYERLPIELEIHRPAELFSGTALKQLEKDKERDLFFAPNYYELVDGPILIAALDTAMIDIGGTKVLIHTHSPTGRVKSKDLVEHIQPTLEAQREYLGGTLPVNRYAFLLFLNPEGEFYLSGAAGALEHSYSSFYALFEGESESIGESVRDVAAHEFFHVVTPLLIHSEEIHYFDFIEPKMSKHLWMYEGVTEYSAQHVQVKQQMIDAEEFLARMSQKMRTADQFKDFLSFTEMSKECLTTHKSQYMNVYLKGALIGMCIDLKLRKLSKGSYGIQDMMSDLGKEYGIDKPFKDDELFDEIVRLTGYKELGDFFAKHVAGREPLPVAQYLEYFGIIYQEEGEAEELSLFGFDPNGGGIGFDAKTALLKIEKPDSFGEDVLGFKVGDRIKAWQGEELSLNNINNVLTAYASSAKEGKTLSVTVLRQGDDGKDEELELSATLKKMTIKAKHVLSINPNASPEQVALRKAWINQ